jgi:hypothetical protein
VFAFKRFRLAASYFSLMAPKSRVEFSARGGAAKIGRCRLYSRRGSI